MPWKFWRRWSLPTVGHTRRTQPRHTHHRYQPGFECLETRTTPSSFADLQITKDDQVTQAVPGQTVTYTIIVSNPDQFSLVVGANVRDAFPASLRGVTYTATAKGGATRFTAAGAGDINDIVDMPPRSTITYKATGTIDPAAEGLVEDEAGLVNTASITPPPGVIDPDPDNNVAIDANDLTPAADVAINMTAAGAGKRRLLYMVTVRNFGPSNAKGVVLADLLPPKTLFIAQAQTSGPAFVLGNNGNQITNTIDVLPAGAAATFKLLVIAPRNCCVFNVATVNSKTSDPNPGNNVSSLTTRVGNKNQCWLAQVYRDIIKREIGAPALKKGLAFLNQPGDPRTLRLQYMQQLLCSLLYQARVSHDAYNNLLHESNHNDDCIKSLNFLHTGGTPEQLHAMLLGDPEYFARRGGGTQAGWAAALFQDIFGRPIDAAGAALIKSLLAKGLTREAIAKNLLNSVEARIRLVRGWFQQYLLRDPKQAELTRFVKDLGRGVPDKQIIAIIVASPEYFEKCKQSEPFASASHSH